MEQIKRGRWTPPGKKRPKDARRVVAIDKPYRGDIGTAVQGYTLTGDVIFIERVFCFYTNL